MVCVCVCDVCVGALSFVKSIEMCSDTGARVRFFKGCYSIQVRVLT